MGGKSTARQGKQRRDWFAAREQKLCALALRQHGVVARAQLLDAGFGLRTIERRVERGQLRRLHRGVYVLGGHEPSRKGDWLAAVFSCGAGALLSHRSAAQLWGLMRPQRGPVEVSAPAGRGRSGIVVHEGGLAEDDKDDVEGIPITSVARTLFDLAEVVKEEKLRQAWEEADRLKLLVIADVEAVCARGYGRRALRPIGRLVEEAQAPEVTNSPLEDRVVELCRKHGLPRPVTNVHVLGREVDAFWPAQKVMVEADSYEFHGHRAAFERDRARDAAMQAEGYRVIRLTYRRMEQEPDVVAVQLHRLLERRAGD